MSIITLVLADVAKAHGVNTEAITGTLRRPHITEARHHWYYRLVTASQRGETRLSLNGIAEKVGKHRTTILYGAAKWAKDNGLPQPTGYNIKPRSERQERQWVQ